jgi:hypothetical protein
MDRLRQFSPLFFIFSFIVTLFFYETAKSLLSISMFGLLGSVVLTHKPKDLLLNYWSNKAYLVFGISFLMLFLYVPLSENVGYAWNRMEIKGPILGMAIAFASIGKIERRYYHAFLAVYVLLCFLTAGFTLLNYILNYDLITESYLRAKVMPSILNHVRLSVMLAMGAYLAYYLYTKNYKLRYFSKWIFLCVAVFCFCSCIYIL